MSTTIYGRLIIKQGSGVPTVPPSTDHNNGDWIATDIYEGEFYQDTDTGIIYTRDSTGITKSIFSSYIEVDLADTDILALNSSPFELLPSLAADKYYYIQAIILEYSFDTTAYVMADYLTITTGGKDINYVASNFITGSGATPKKVVHLTSQNSDIDGGSNITFTPDRNISSTSVVLTALSDPTTGDGTIKAKIYYKVMNFG